MTAPVDLLPVSELSRRRLLGGSAGSLTLWGLTACGSSGGAASSASSATSGGWHWTDDRGTKVSLSSRPKRVAVLTDTVGAALWAAGVRPVAATNSKQGVTRAVGFDYTGVEVIGAGTPDINLEQLAAARPDLLVDAVQANGTLQTTSANPKARDIAPVVGIDMYHPVQRIVGTADRLAVALGRTLTDAKGHAAYNAAATELRAAAKRRPGLRVGFVFDISSSEIGVMNPKTWPVLQTVAGLGVRLVPVPAGAANQYSQSVSLENATSIPADLLVWAVADPMPTSPVWQRVPAVAAGQIWQPDLPSWYAYSWANFATLLGQLATHVSHSRPNVGAAA